MHLERVTFLLFFLVNGVKSTKSDDAPRKLTIAAKHQRKRSSQDITLLTLAVTLLLLSQLSQFRLRESGETCVIAS